MDKAALKTAFTERLPRFVEEWKEFLRHKSISTDPAYDGDCRACAEWLRLHLEHMGFRSELLETPGKPVVYAEIAGEKSSPTIVFYGHYDVQPVDPVEEWRSPPFEPELRDGKMWARGAEDNKGQVFYFLKAVETLLDMRALKCGLKIFLEGEEECSSKGISAAMSGWRDKLKGDVLMVCDTGSMSIDIPTITMGLRGIVHLTVSVGGLHKDLHSGVHGGVVKNPALEMARLLASLHNPDGSIAVKGFYDEVRAPSSEDRNLANDGPFPKNYEEIVGAPPNGGEAGYSAPERRGFRPTIEINGIHSGYGGPGSKTIIPSFAIAKISSRLVGGQDPSAAMKLIEEHLKAHAPAGLKIDFPERGIGGPALLLSSASPTVVRAAKVLKDIFAREPAYTWEGASIPVVSSLAALAGAEPILVGFGLEEDNIHAPNESFSLRQFEQGFLYASMFLSSF